MKNLFKLSSLLFVGLVFMQVSCSDDPPPEADPLIGNWAMSGAIFNSTIVPPSVTPLTVLSIENFPDGTGGTTTLHVPSGESILALTIGAMADNVCANPANYATFFLELTADGKLFLNCPNEDVREDTGTWVRLEDPTAGTIISLIVVTDIGDLTIAFSDFVMLADGSKFSGQTNSFPMVQVFGEDLALGTNLQLLNSNMEFTRVP